MNTVKTAAILVIGNEILSGRTHDKNGNHIVSQLTEVGIQAKEIRVIADIEDEIITTLNALRSKYDYVFTTGGIGPTHDDITAECVAKAFGRVLEIHKQAYDVLFAHYGSLEEFNEARQKMAMIPNGKDVHLINNPVSAAPGFSIENVYVMAGVPRIMQAMLEQILPTLQTGYTVHSLTLSCDLGEGVVAKDVGFLQKKYPNIDIGCYPYFRKGNFGVSLVLRGQDMDFLNSVSIELTRILESLGADNVS